MRKVIPLVFIILVFAATLMILYPKLAIPVEYQEKSFCEQKSDCIPTPSCNCYNKYHEGFSSGYSCGIPPGECDCVENLCVAVCEDGHVTGETWFNENKSCECMSNGGIFCSPL